MKSYTNTPKNILCLSFCIYLFIFAGLLMAESAITSVNAAESPKTNKKVDRFVSIDFNDVDINVFIKFISELTGKNFVVDQRVKGKVTIISPAKISVKEAYKVFESVLEVHGYTTIKAGKVIKIVPSPDARSKNIETRLKEDLASPEDKIVTQLIPLKYADPDEIKRLFAPMISKSSVILSYPPTNMLIVTDVYSNITRLVRILKTIDIAGIGQEISVIPLEFSDATKLVKLLSSIFKTTVKSKKKGPGKAVKFVADERTNTIVLLASENDTVRIKELVKLLDKETPKGEGNIHVYYLQNANAEDLAKVLMAIPVKQGKHVKKGEKPVISRDVQIIADNSTNSLVITAKKDDFRVLEEVIKKLDITRRMVYIEALIMEVRVTKDFQLGVEWNAIDRAGSYDGRQMGVFGGSTLGESIFPTVTRGGTASLPTGFSLGVLGEGITIGDVIFPNIGAVIRALQTDSDVHILSTPQILTTDNEEAEIKVGENVPYLTKSATGDQNYETYEYKDIGVSLKITPQINQERFVRLNIFQEVIKLTEDAKDANYRPTTLKRSAQTTVIVKDGNTVVIGGLIGDDMSRTNYKVPCLGDIPLLGSAFKSISRSGTKTNLFVFLTPHIIENPAEAKKVYKEKKEQIDKVREGVIKMYKEKK